jgi:hypothetical protein
MYLEFTVTQFGDAVERFQICVCAGSETGAEVNVQNGQRVSAQLGQIYWENKTINTSILFRLQDH